MAVAFEAFEIRRRYGSVAQPAAAIYEDATIRWDVVDAASTEGNRLLRDLPDDESARLQLLLKSVELSSMQEITSPGEPFEWVYFPDSCVISLVTSVNGGGVEALTVGRDGMSAFPMIGGARTAFARSVCQIPGRARRAQAREFLATLDEMPELKRRLLLYAVLAFDVTAQSAACNRMHVTEERCARWLLMSQDRAGRNDFKLTQTFLAQMLGVRRPAVTVAVGILERAGLIAHRRGRIQVVDRSGLEGAACECYASIRDRQEELLGF
jgi:CRP-like cAMP-binding protein